MKSISDITKSLKPSDKALQFRFNKKGGYEPPRTPSGYYWDEVLSAMQKEIRRGHDYEAVYWAMEGEAFNAQAIWNRLKIIASEDVGIADPCAPFVIEVLKNQYDEFKGKPNDESYKLFLANAVLLLAKAPKSRMVDDIVIVVDDNLKHKSKRLEIPDYALDKHTFRGKRMGRGWEHFFTEGAILENQTVADPYQEKAKEIKLKKK